MIVRRKRTTGGERCKSFSFLVEIGDPDVRQDMARIFANKFIPCPYDYQESPTPEKETISEQELIVTLTHIDSLPYTFNDVFATLFPYGFFGHQTAEQIAKFIIRRAVAMELLRPCESAPGQYYFIADKFKKRGRPPKNED